MTSNSTIQQTKTATMYEIDRTHSSVGFGVRHMMFANVKGTVGIKSATVTHDASDVRNTLVEAVLDPSTINTGVADRDAHLRSADFFDVATFPEWTFRSTLVESEGTNEYTLHGDLTIRGQTHPVSLKVEKLGEGKDPWGNQKIALQATATIDRTKWGLTWNQVLEAGGVLVSEKVKLELDLQFGVRK